uniref:Spermine oxidase n=1 Tax=Cacopsylla melanoneura TaxID=428564 RepID=A0A8D8SUJ6_9HEMI
MNLLLFLLSIITVSVGIHSVRCADSQNKTKLIIIGAGPSGLAAATKLITDGVDEFIILEAENRIGGRVYNLPYEGDTFIDMGAQWVHGQEGNPVYQMAKEHQLVKEECPTFSGVLCFNSSREPVDKELASKLLKTMFDVVESQDEDSVRDMSNYNGSLGDFVLERVRTQLSNNASLSHLLSSPRFEELVEYFGKYENSVDGSDSWFQTSAKGLAQYESLKGCNNVEWKKGGYGNVIKLLLKQLPGQTPIDLSKNLHLNKEVTSINWSEPNSIIVNCSDGTSYTGDRVLVTVSLGVLKNRTDLFEPTLPSWKKDAIEGLFFGSDAKIFLRFPNKWWPDEVEGFNLFWTHQDEKTLFKEIGGVDGRPWVMDVYGFYTNSEDPQTLLGWVSGPSARYMESLTDDQVILDSTKLLRHFLSSNYTIPDPIRLVRSSWYSNPHFKGSYSCRSLETEAKNTSAAELGAPVVNGEGKPVLLFAGEATNPKHYSTVHGAIETSPSEMTPPMRTCLHLPPHLYSPEYTSVQQR